MNLKVNMVLFVEYKKDTDDKNMELKEVNFKTQNDVILQSKNLEVFLRTRKTQNK